jgi:hypothetical protein
MSRTLVFEVIATGMLFILPNALAAPTSTTAGSNPAGPANDVVIYLVDRSGSVGMLEVPDTVEAAIVHQVQVAQLARTPAKFLVVVYSGQGVTVIGDKEGQPTLAYETFLERLHAEFPRPNGTTPLVEALTAALKVIKALSPGQRVTVIHCGDGQPCGPFDPDRYPSVAKFIADRTAAATRDVRPEDQQAKVDELHRQWADPESPDGKLLHALWLKEEFAECKRVAAGCRDRNVRFVSIDFNGLSTLKELHEAAGGAPDDYLLVKPASRLIDVLHERGLTRYDGVLVSKPIEVKESDSERNVVGIRLNKFANSALVTAVFREPVPQFTDHLRAGFKVDGRVTELSADGGDPSARLSYDNAGRVATASLLLPTMPSNHAVAFACRRRDQSKLPPLTIYIHERLKTSLQVVLRPLNSKPNDTPPFVVSPDQPVIWQSYLEDAETGAPLPLAAIDVVLRETRQQTAQRLDLVKDADTDGLFKSPAAMQLAQGQYDAEVSISVGRSEPLLLRLPEHIKSQLGDEHVTLEIDPETSASITAIDAGELGDAVVEAVVKCRLRAGGATYPLPVQLSVVELVDAAGTPLPGEIVKLSQTELALQPGQPSTFVQIRFKLPEHLGHTPDGPVVGRLAITRTDTKRPLRVEPYGDSDGDTAQNEIRFYLRRPIIKLSAQRAWRNELISHKANASWPVHVRIWRPMRRGMELCVSHTSQIDRDVSVVLSGPFRTAEGRTYPNLKLMPRAGGQSSQIISAGGSACWKFDLAIPADLPDKSVSTTLQVFGPGLRSSTIPVVIDSRRPLLGPALQRVFTALASVLSASGLVRFVRAWRLRKYRRGAPVDIRAGESFDFLTVRAGRPGEAVLEFDAAGVTRRYRDDSNGLPVNSRETLTPVDVSDANPLLFSVEKEGSPLTIAIERIETDPTGPVLQARIDDPGTYDDLRTRNGRKLRRAICAATISAAAATYIYHESVVSLLQWCSDAISLF